MDEHTYDKTYMSIISLYDVKVKPFPSVLVDAVATTKLLCIHVLPIKSDSTNHYSRLCCWRNMYNSHTLFQHRRLL